VFFMLLPATARACAVCFGAPFSPWNRGFFWAILLLLVLPFALMGALVGLIVFHIRKNRRILSATP